jgi:hypothetical protein
MPVDVPPVPRAHRGGIEAYYIGGEAHSLFSHAEARHLLQLEHSISTVSPEAELLTMEPTGMIPSFTIPELGLQSLDVIYVDRYLVSSFVKFGGELMLYELSASKQHV